MIQNKLFNLTNKIVRKVINKTDDTSFSLQCPLFPNQINFGKKITKSFLNKNIFMLLAIAPTQSGKTGSMISTIMYMCRNPRIALPKENVFIITGLSSKDWINQTKERFPIEILQFSLILKRNSKEFERFPIEILSTRFEKCKRY